MLGHGLVTHKSPSAARPFEMTSLVTGSIRVGSIPGRGRIAIVGITSDPGVEGCGEIRIPPVSVCHHVSTILHLGGK